MTMRIFVRERRKVEEGEKAPRFRIVGISGGDLKIHLTHIRRQELEQIAETVGAEIIYLTHAGDQSGKQG